MNKTDKKEASSQIRVVVAEDHAMVRQGFVTLINDEEGLDVCAEADSGSTTLAALEKQRPDILIMDLLLKGEDGIELIKQVKALHPRLPVLVISMQDEQVYAERALRAGAAGYIMKNQAADEFVNAIHTVLDGEIYVSRKMNVRLLHRYLERKDSAGDTSVGGLTDRELHVYQMIGAGMATRQIAVDMGISPKTVETYRENIKQKLSLKDARALSQSATRWVEENQG